MAQTLERALTDPEFIARLDAVPDAGFTWDGVADRLASVYRDLSDSISRSRRPGPLRIGVVGRLDRPGDPEVQSCLHEVVAPLAADDRFSVTAFTIGEPPVETLRPPCPVGSLVGLFESWLAGELDAVVYAANDRTLRRVAQVMGLVPGYFVPLGDVAATSVTDCAIARLQAGHDLPDDVAAAMSTASRSISEVAAT